MITREALQQFHHSDRILLRDTDFIYLLAHPALREYISNYTITFPRKGLLTERYTVMPHGSATLVFQCTDSGMTSSLFGALTKPVCVGQGINSCCMLFIVEFQPAGYYAFCGMPQKEITNLVFSFGDIDSSLYQSIARHLETENQIESLIFNIDRLFLRQLTECCIQSAFSIANQMIIRSSGQLSVNDISQSVFYSKRHLNRIFDQYLGCNVKSYSRLVRINKVLHLLQRPSANPVQICMQCGFYDMPHFIHDFKSICGITPMEYRENMSDFYSEIAKF